MSEQLTPPNSKLTVIQRAGRLIGAAIVIWILAMAIVQFFAVVPGTPPVSGKLSSRWALTLLELGLFVGMLLAGLVAGLVWLAQQRWPKRWAGTVTSLAILRSKWRLPAWILTILIGAFPAFLLLNTYWGDLFTGLYLRLALLLAAVFLVAIVLPVGQTNLFSRPSLAFGIVFVGALFLIGGQFMQVNNYPFSLTWSEGNRLYEYSIFFTPQRYQIVGELSGMRGAVGRFLLWGLPFIIPNAPIWVHRLWNAILSTLPHLVLGLVLARQGWQISSSAGSAVRNGKAGEGREINRPDQLEIWIFTLWIFLFLAQGPIYTPLILSALLIALLVRPDTRWQWLAASIIATAAAGYYASLSRWTWLPAAPAWAVLILLSDWGVDIEQNLRDRRIGAAIRRLFITLLIALAGLGGGLLANPKLMQPVRLSQSTALSQPLLWYRLLPNATYPEGVLLALALATVPVIILLVWLKLSGRWRPGWLFNAAALAAGLVFLGGGIVASAKIGGGNNLHNLDMFLVTLALLAGLAWNKQRQMAHHSQQAGFAGWPASVRLILALALFLPAWSAFKGGTVLKLPMAENTRKALEAIRTQAAAADGLVLFIDQRQLLAFDYVKDLPVVTEYEKKYMMDQAMAGNAEYFMEFYRDLAARRFALIVSDMQFTLEKDSSYAFGEENNAWVKWVAEPLLCYYTPVRTMQNVDIQLLAPKPNPVGCPK